MSGAPARAYRDRLVERDEPSLPLWVEECVSAGGFSLVSVRLSGLEGMDVLGFEQSVAGAYRMVLEGMRGGQPLRFWAFIPRIHADCGDGLDRYMAFNAGRFAAFSSWLGGPEGFGLSLPTASAVGSRGGDLVLHGLASHWPATPIENPRQVPAYRYSTRFGPRPPCFARATLVRREPDLPDLLLVGGTASITGEDSRHGGELVAQINETFRNLASVVRSACGGPRTPLRDVEVPRWLGSFRELRVYVREAVHQARILAMVEAAFPGARRIETLPAELCRPELLVEIEGLALPPKG